MDAPRFDPRTATEYEIWAKALTLKDRTLGDIADSRWSGQVSSSANKGGAGAIVERFFGIPGNSEQLPDFVGAGIELKVCPLVFDGDTAKRIKERTSVTMIDYMALDSETWPTASVKKKIARILFVFYAWKPDVPLGDMRIVKVKLWSPPDELLPYMERDWLAVWEKNHHGRAEEISEGDGKVLGAATKGQTGGRAKQPHSDEMARTRAWSLKPRLTWSIYSSPDGRPLHGDLMARLRGESAVDPVDVLQGRLEALVGMTVSQIAEQHGITPGASKNRVASVVRGAIGLRAKKLPVDLEALGLELKTLPLGPNALPFEATSFPAFDPRELADEEWEDCDLLARLQNVLFVPLYRETRQTDLLEQRLCRPFRWEPSREELRGIRWEWEQYRDRVKNGLAGEPLNEAATSYIHVRPHGRDGSDRVDAPGGVVVARMCFWLNRHFIQELVRAAHGDWMGF